MILISLLLSASPITYDSIKPILVKHCSSCHNQGWPDKNWLDPETARKNAAKLKQRAWINRDMPPGNFTEMQDNERELIKLWVDGGAKLEGEK